MFAPRRLSLCAPLLCLVSCTPSNGPQPETARPVYENTAGLDGAAPDVATDLSGLQGRWRAAESADERADRQSAIDSGTEGLGRLVRGRARTQLAERTEPAESLEIAVDDTTVSILTEAHRLEMELGGPPAALDTGDGTFRFVARAEGDRLVVTATGPSGGRTTTYRRDGAALVVEVAVRGDRLDRALEYSTTYVGVR